MIRHEIDAKTAMLYADKRMLPPGRVRHVVLQQVRQAKPWNDGDGFVHEVELSGVDLVKLFILYLSRGSFRLRRLVSRMLWEDSP
jgi:hypothetical protein